MNRTVCFASAVSEIQQSDIYMTVKARIFETPKANLNGVRVTPAFLSEIVKNKEKYIGLPVCADVKALANGRYDHLGHLYDARTGEFKSAMVGSFYDFEEEEFEGGAYLVGYARILKRNKAVCKAIAELFGSDALKFSFEIVCGSYEELDDGTIQIDADESNFLEGAAIVTFPACEDAVALDLVAECNRIADERGETEMPEANEMMEQNTEPEVEVAEEVQQENAEVYVTETHTEIDRAHTYDTDTCEEVSVENVHTETVSTLVSEETENEVVVADDPSPDPDPEEGEDEEDAECSPDPDDEKEKTAELIAQLMASVQALTEEIKALKEAKKTPVIAEVNPFMDTISAPKKYDLLEQAEPNGARSLLEKA